MPTMGRVSLPDLPEDVFLLILDHLELWDLVRCGRVSRSWMRVCSDPDHRRVMLKRYPLAREVRSLATQGSLSQLARASEVDWIQIFDRVAGRYYHLAHGRARSMTTLTLGMSEMPRHWFPVSPWDYHESQPNGRLDDQRPDTNQYQGGPAGDRAYRFRPCLWSYEDGLLVYVPSSQQEFRWDQRAKMTVPVHYALVLLDLDTHRQFPIPFDVKKRVVRNFRLRHRTLVVEWAEETSFHALNDLERVHRHFASCYDITPGAPSSPGLAQPPTWTITFRNEFKLHFLGLPLNTRDRFFSTHTATHYAAYFWQPNRSMYTGDEEPLERLFAWDIRTPSAYLPSLDPTGRQQAATSPRSGPCLVSRLNFHDLDHLGIRQHSAISLMSLHINPVGPSPVLPASSPSSSTSDPDQGGEVADAGTDDACLVLTLRFNTCVAGQGYFDPAERLWNAQTVSLPACGVSGPPFRREWDGHLPPYRGHGSMESVDVLAPEKWFLGIMDVVDDGADVRFSLVETVFTGLGVVGHRRLVRIRTARPRDGFVALADPWADQVSYMGRIAGDERFLIGQNDKAELVVLRF